MNYEEKATFEKRRQSIWDEVEKKLVYRKKHHYNKRKSRSSEVLWRKTDMMKPKAHESSIFYFFIYRKEI